MYLFLLVSQKKKEIVTQKNCIEKDQTFKYSFFLKKKIGEIAPKEIRGKLTTLNTLVITFGQVVAYIFNIAFANVHEGWRYMFGVAAIPPLIQLVFIAFLPESPRQLIISGRQEEAKKVIRKIYGNKATDEFIDEEIKNIVNDIAISQSGKFSDFKKVEHYKPLIIGKSTLYQYFFFKKKKLLHIFYNEYQWQ